MRILSFGTDKKIFDSTSAVFLRQQKYAAHFDALDIVIPAKNEYTHKVEGNVSLFPTQTDSKFGGFFALIKKGMSVEKPDVITVQDPFEIGLAGLIVAKMRGVPLHVQIHSDPFSKGFVRHSFMNRIRKMIMMFVVRRAARVRVVLESIKNHLEEKGITAPITVLPIYVDARKFADVVRKRHPRFAFSALCIGRLTAEKNFSRAINAVKKLRDDGFDIGLTIVGEGPLRKTLETTVQELGLIGRVEFVGEQADVTPYLELADILLVTSKYEGYGLVIVEALSAGIPVLSTDVGVAREAGALVTIEKDFAKTLKQWCQGGARNAQLQAKMYANEEEYIARYTGDIAASTE